MSPPNNQKPKGKITQLWKNLYGLSLWLGAGIGQFITFNIDTDADLPYSAVVAGLGTLVSAAVIGLALQAPKISRTAATVRFWYKCAVASLIALVVLMFLYIPLKDSWTCKYNDGYFLVMGDHESTFFQDFILAHPESTDRCSALKDFTYHPGIMYKDALITKFIALALVYVLAWVSLSLLIVSLSNSYQIKHQKLPIQ